MSRCIKCNYALVLWPHKSKYKCAKCSKVWTQKLIDDVEFRKWNKLQKELLKQQYPDSFEEAWINYKKQFQKSKKDQKIQRREYYLKNREKILERNRKWIKKHAEYEKKRHQIYNKKNKVLIKFIKRPYLLKNKDKIRERHRNYRLQRLEYLKNKCREYYYKNRDKISEQRRAQYRLKRAVALMFEETARRRSLLPKFYAKRPLLTFSTTFCHQLSHSMGIRTNTQSSFSVL